MTISSLPILSMIRTRMQWHQERQRVLAENVANADTPKFQPRDLTELKFNQQQAGAAPLGLARTNAGHLGGTGLAAQTFQSKSANFQVRPSGNSVNLEDEMLKVANNQMDYQAAATLYTRSLGLFKTAMGKK